MNKSSIAGIILIIAGVAGLVWGGGEIPIEQQVAEIGPVEIETQSRDVEIPTWLAIATVAGGIVLVGVGARKS